VTLRATAVAGAIGAIGAIEGAGCDAAETSVGAWNPTTKVYVEAESADLTGPFVVGSDPAASLA